MVLQQRHDKRACQNSKPGQTPGLIDTLIRDPEARFHLRSGVDDNRDNVMMSSSSRTATGTVSQLGPLRRPTMAYRPMA